MPPPQGREVWGHGGSPGSKRIWGTRVGLTTWTSGGPGGLCPNPCCRFSLEGPEIAPLEALSAPHHPDHAWGPPGPASFCVSAFWVRSSPLRFAARGQRRPGQQRVLAGAGVRPPGHLAVLHTRAARSHGCPGPARRCPAPCPPSAGRPDPTPQPNPAPLPATLSGAHGNGRRRLEDPQLSRVSFPCPRPPSDPLKGGGPLWGIY